MLQNCIEKQAPLKLTAVPHALRTHVHLAPLTSFRVGGYAEWYAAPRNADELIACFNWACLEQIPIMGLGAGSNLLISDQGLPGLVLSTRYLQGTQFDPLTGRVTVLAGEPLPRLAWEVARRGWQGLEWAAGIPGTVGGAAVMNAGAQGSCFSDLMVNAQVLTSQGLQWMSREELQYGYRCSVLQKKRSLVIQTTLQLEPGADPQNVLALTRKNLIHRKNTQPYHLPSCGSVFRNPEGYKAGWLIERSGLKGYQIGKAQVSQRHANFIVNVGGATASNIFDLINYVQERIESEWGIHLEPEVKILGHFPRNTYLTERTAS